MALHVFLLVVCLFLSLALLWRLDWFHLRPSSSGGATRTTRNRLLKPRTPDDCPACRLCCTNSSVEGPAPAPVRPWCEVKSRRGEPKRVNTEGFACPNQQCVYFGITDADIHALVGDCKHGQAERIQTFLCRACHTTFTARRHTPLYRLKTPLQQIAKVRISRWPKDWTLPPPSGSSATGKRPSPPGCPVLASTLRPCTSARSAPSGSHICSWMSCAPGCAAPIRCCGSG